jgi:D-3-phosphoglycerate dehydrogenase/(S)-sulfolactate dehydrogenase
MNIVISEMIHSEALTHLSARAEAHYDPELHAHRDTLAEALGEADALIVRNQTQVDSELLEHAPKLKVVGRLGVGLDNLELDTLRARNVTVTRATSSNAVSVAEYVMGAMLDLSRRYQELSRELHGGRWNRQAAIGTELYGKALGIVGLGDIGGRLAKRAKAFGMQVLAADPVIFESSFAVQEYGLGQVELEVLLEHSDFVSLHAPLLPGTRNLINAAALARMKPTATLINTARGGLVDEDALAEALKEGKIAGAVLDVRQQEPPGKDDPLRGLPNALLTPHVAGVTQESNRRASLHVAEDVLRVLQGEKPLSAV